jgi:very-short-patch-repair endonuclease
MSAAEYARSPGIRDVPRTRGEKRLLALASRQHGLVSLDQARTLGFSSSAVSRRLDTGTWKRVLPRTFCIAGSAASLEQRALAAVLWAGEGAVASHGTACALWGLARPVSGTVHVTTGRELGHPPAGIRAHKSAFAPGETGSLRRVSVTSPSRTLLDVAGERSHDALLPLVERAVVDGLVTVPQLLRIADRHRGRRGVARLRKVLDLGVHEGRWASALEREVQTLLESAGLPPYEREHPVGPYRIDFAWPGALAGIEADGRLWHSSRADFRRDRAKHNFLLAEGWRILRVTRRDLNEPGQVLARLRALLEA